MDRPYKNGWSSAPYILYPGYNQQSLALITNLASCIKQAAMDQLAAHPSNNSTTVSSLVIFLRLLCHRDAAYCDSFPMARGSSDDVHVTSSKCLLLLGLHVWIRFISCAYCSTMSKHLWFNLITPFFFVELQLTVHSWQFVWHLYCFSSISKFLSLLACTPCNIRKIISYLTACVCTSHRLFVNSCIFHLILIVYCFIVVQSA
jgi:hypothetical protein